MSQQTQVQRVVGFYTAWLRRFPTLKAMSRASKPDILAQWSGLGYNNRALRLHRLAQEVMRQGGTLPSSVEELRQLPGVGKYTAHAVACFAFGLRVPVVDVNIRRLLSRFFSRMNSATEMIPEKDAWTIAERILPATNVPGWNQSLMELGALVCTARTPRCTVCPISRSCLSAHSKRLLAAGNAGKKKEPSFKGVPRRIYRGRILKSLHRSPLTPREIGMRVVDDFRSDDLRWIGSILRTMEKDGLIAVERKGKNERVRVAR